MSTYDVLFICSPLAPRKLDDLMEAIRCKAFVIGIMLTEGTGWGDFIDCSKEAMVFARMMQN